MTESEQKKLAEELDVALLNECGVGNRWTRSTINSVIARHFATQPVPQPPGATCDEYVYGVANARPCGNLLPCSTHPTRGVARSTPDPKGVPPSGDVVRDERAAMLEEFRYFPEPQALLVRAIIFLLKERP